MDRPDALILGWFLILGGATITLLRHRLAEFRRDLDDGRRAGGRKARPADLTLNGAIFAALGVLLMLGGLLMIAEEPVLQLLGVS
jgi:hypothetical protein